MPSSSKSISYPILRIHNIRLFIAFRVFFTSRFYYPVFTILFLDLGLTLEQFALLNAVWAASIVLLEIPSGALADIVGRRSLLVFAGITMVVEISLLCFVPHGNTAILFPILLINRILSGAAEAAASGADEAIAYDTIMKRGLAGEWPHVLTLQMRYQSAVHIITMAVGAAVYDPAFIQKIVNLVGYPVQVSQGASLRFPLFLTLFMAFGTLLSAWHMSEADSGFGQDCIGKKQCIPSVVEAFRLTLRAGRWILQTPFALMIILTGLLFDHCIRMIITLSSQYYRLIHLPEASFGIIASCVTGMGLFVPQIAGHMIQRFSPRMNLMIMVGFILPGLVGMIFIWPFVGLVPMILVFSVMYLVPFFSSHYMNRITDSNQRATVLSFKGLLFNLAYGLFGLLYAVVLKGMRHQAIENNPLLKANELDDIIFVKSLSLFPGYFFIMLIGLWVLAYWLLKNNDEYKHAG